jgi:hypothetical protein
VEARRGLNISISIMALARGGKIDRLHRTPAGFTTPTFDDRKGVIARWGLKKAWSKSRGPMDKHRITRPTRLDERGN